MCCMREDLLRERQTRLRINTVCASELTEHQRVVSRIDNNSDALMILSGGPQHCGAADIDVLDRVVERAFGTRHRLLERVEVDDEDFDRVDRVLGQRAHVRDIRAVRE